MNQIQKWEPKQRYHNRLAKICKNHIIVVMVPDSIEDMPRLNKDKILVYNVSHNLFASLHRIGVECIQCLPKTKCFNIN